MLVSVSQFDWGSAKAKCYLDARSTSFELQGVSTSSLNSTGGSFDRSHLARPWGDDDVSPDALAVLAAENAAMLVSDGPELELWGGCFGFDADEGEESEVTVRFLPQIDTIAQLPSFQRNVHWLKKNLDEVSFTEQFVQEVQRYAEDRRVNPGLCLPILLLCDTAQVHALLRLELNAGLASICTLKLFGSAHDLIGPAKAVQPSCSSGDFVEVGSVENLMIYRDKVGQT